MAVNVGRRKADHTLPADEFAGAREVILAAAEGRPGWCCGRLAGARIALSVRHEASMSQDAWRGAVRNERRWEGSRVQAKCGTEVRQDEM